MSANLHRIYIALLSVIVLITIILLAFQGFSYYRLPLEERFYHEGFQSLKPGGMLGHGYGILGTFLMITGILMYMARKRMRSLARLGRLSHWLEFHIFLCTLGPLLILFHTSFKFGGIVAVSFWSMVAVFLSGIIGRFIYIRIPRTIEGRELTLQEVREAIRNNDSGEAGGKQLKRLIRKDAGLNRKIERLALLQKLFRYWHVAHLPFAFIMLIIMVIHVIVTIVFGYRWIF